jgi:hypothetical protein
MPTWRCTYCLTPREGQRSLQTRNALSKPALSALARAMLTDPTQTEASRPEEIERHGVGTRGGDRPCYGAIR